MRSPGAGWAGAWVPRTAAGRLALRDAVRFAGGWDLYGGRRAEDVNWDEIGRITEAMATDPSLIREAV